jgi:3-hydroxyisobutyrate dehydrogenase
MATVAFIGMGSMGRPMALALQNKGFSVVGYDVAANSRQIAQEKGIACTDSLADATKNADFVVSMVPTGTHVREVYASKGGVFSLARKDAVLIDSSTIDVGTSRDLHALAGQQGLNFLDAPVTGAVPAAEAASLTFMVGGEATVLQRAAPVLDAMGKATFHVGAGGSGHAMKICNNMMTGMSMVATSEVFALGERFGLSYQDIFNVVSRGSGGSWIMTNYCPVPGPVPSTPANSGYASKFSIEMMLKDMRLSQAAAESLSASTPLGAATAAIYQMAVNNGISGEDFSAVFKLISGRLKEASR